MGAKLVGFWNQLADVMIGIANMSPGAGPAGLAIGLVWAIFGAYCLYKMLELMGTVDGGSYWPAKLLGILKEYRKTTIVYALIMASTPFTVAMTALARAETKASMASIKDSVGGGVAIFGTAMGNAGQFMEYGGDLISRNTPALHNFFMDTQQQANDAINQGLANVGALLDAQNAKAARNIGPNVPPQLKVPPLNFNNQWRNAVIDAKQAGKQQPAAAKDNAGSNWIATITRIGAASQTAGMSEVMLAAVKAVACYVLGGALAILLLVGLIAGLMTLVKEGFSALSYLAGTSLAMGVGGLLASVFAPAFALCFISDKTEPYGRNWVNFMFSMVFAAFAIHIAGKFVGGLMLLATTASVGKGIELFCVGANESLGGMAGYFAGAAGCFFIGGMVVSFAGEFLKRAASIGSGVWSGSFSA